METSYRGLDYKSGKAIQSLRNAIGLTQVGLAEHLGVSVRTVKEWEAGGSYLKVERLKALIALAVQYQVFPKGSEAEEIRALWRTTHQKRVLDENWLSALLAGPPSLQEQSPNALRLDVAPPQRATPVPANSSMDAQFTSQEQKQEALQLDVAPPQRVTLIPVNASDESVGTVHLLYPVTTSQGDHTRHNGSLREPEEEMKTEHFPLLPAPLGDFRSNLHSDEQSCRDAGSEALSERDLVNISSADASWQRKTRVWRKRLLISLIALAILTIIGSAGTLFFQTRSGAAAQSNKMQAYPGYLPGHGTLAFSDPLSQERRSQWRSNGGMCQFVGGAYHVSRQLNGAYSLCGVHGMFSNFALEIQLTIMQGNCGGMDIRNDSRGRFYKFTICQNGGYRLSKFVENGASTLLCTGWSSAIHTGLGRQNTIAVVASGSTMTFYANEQRIAQAQDSSYASGLIWLTADPNPRNTTDVVYRNARLWTL